MLALGPDPTPVALLDSLSTRNTSLWIKRDDLTHPLYGGNKVRKLSRLLADAARVGAPRIVTVGAIGSHHVLATGVFGRLARLPVDAVVLPQPNSRHVLETARASRAQGVGLFPAESYAQAAAWLKARVAEGAYLIPAGGTNQLGTLGIVDAAAELAEQIRQGELPEPELIVVALGSGGTVAGLLAGLTLAGLRTRVLAVTVVEPAQLFEHRARALAKTLVDAEVRLQLSARLECDRRYLGPGYGYATPASAHATREAERFGVVLDDTYTAKAFAAALDRVAAGTERTILFWHTLSSAPLAPLLAGAPNEAELDPALRRLAR